MTHDCLQKDKVGKLRQLALDFNVSDGDRLFLLACKNEDWGPGIASDDFVAEMIVSAAYQGATELFSSREWFAGNSQVASGDSSPDETMKSGKVRKFPSTTAMATDPKLKQVRMIQLYAMAIRTLISHLRL